MSKMVAKNVSEVLQCYEMEKNKYVYSLKVQGKWKLYDSSIKTKNNMIVDNAVLNLNLREPGITFTMSITTLPQVVMLTLTDIQP